MSDEKIEEIIKNVQSTLSFENQSLTSEEIIALKKNIEKNYQNIQNGNVKSVGDNNDSRKKHK